VLKKEIYRHLEFGKTRTHPHSETVHNLCANHQSLQKKLEHLLKENQNNPEETYRIETLTQHLKDATDLLKLTVQNLRVTKPVENQNIQELAKTIQHQSLQYQALQQENETRQKIYKDTIQRNRNNLPNTEIPELVEFAEKYSARHTEPYNMQKHYTAWEKYAQTILQTNPERKGNAVLVLTRTHKDRGSYIGGETFEASSICMSRNTDQTKNILSILPESLVALTERQKEDIEEHNLQTLPLKLLQKPHGILKTALTLYGQNQKLNFENCIELAEKI